MLLFQEYFRRPIHLNSQKRNISFVGCFYDQPRHRIGDIIYCLLTHLKKILQSSIGFHIAITSRWMISSLNPDIPRDLQPQSVCMTGAHTTNALTRGYVVLRYLYIYISSGSLFFFLKVPDIEVRRIRLKMYDNTHLGVKLTM